MKKTKELPLRSAIGPGPEILDGDDVQTVEGHDLTIAVHHRQGARGDQDHLRMPDDIFAAIRGAQRERMETAAGNTLANSFQIHARSISPPPGPVNRATRYSPPIAEPCSPILAFSFQHLSFSPPPLAPRHSTTNLSAADLIEPRHGQSINTKHDSKKTKQQSKERQRQ